MTFDKTKAMRSAERYLAQGKIRSAIDEYKHVVANDPRDFGTMNMLGDLYTKNAETDSAVKYYKRVAEHYAKQGFAQKAIAVYNKIGRIDPRSIEISAELAELYKQRGSVAEARQHYKRLAEHYEKRDEMIEALAMWKEIAFLDPANTEVFLNIAASYEKEGETELSADAFTEAGKRFAAKDEHSRALECFDRSIEFRSCDLATLRQFLDSKLALGEGADAAARLREISEKNPHNREILLLVIDCQIESGNAADAEKSIISLVEQEPANYPKFLELAQVYLNLDDLSGVTRILEMSSEHLLVGGQADEFRTLTSEVLSRDAANIAALRLMIRFYSWNRDSEHLRATLADLAAAANDQTAVEDERYALSQLQKLVPHDTEIGDRLRQIDQENGFDSSSVEEGLFDKFFGTSDRGVEAPGTDASTLEAGFDLEDLPVIEHFEDLEDDLDPISIEGSEPTDIGDLSYETIAADAGAGNEPAGLSPSEELRLQKEIESVKFYIDSGYTDLAEKSIATLRSDFGSNIEIDKLEAELLLAGSDTAAGSEPEAEYVPVQAMPPDVTAASDTGTGDLSGGAKTFDLDEIRSEFGLEELDAADDEDYETHYNTAVAYQEMGLTEEAIREYQDAISLVNPNDGTRRFFQCANLLGHCFMQQGMAKLAVQWYERALESTALTDEEKQGLWYELADAHEGDGNTERAARYLEQVYAENVNFRDVSERVKNMTVAS